MYIAYTKHAVWAYAESELAAIDKAFRVVDETLGRREAARLMSNLWVKWVDLAPKPVQA